MQTNTLHSERRSGERFLVALPVQTNKGPGVTRDVSASGLYLITDQPLTAGESLDLTLDFPDREGAPYRLRARGTVVRVEDAQGSVGAGIALDEGSRYLAQAS